MDPGKKKKTWGWKHAGERSFLPGGSAGASAGGWLGMAGDGWEPLATAGDRWGSRGPLGTAVDGRRFRDSAGNGG